MRRLDPNPAGHSVSADPRRKTNQALPPSVLVFGYSRQALMDRVSVLHEHKYQVIFVSKLASALSLIRKQATKFAFLVIGHAVPERERLRVARRYKTAKRDGHVIFIYDGHIRNADCASALLSIQGDKHNLLGAIRAHQSL